jgi:hypothetical protein
VLDDAHVGDINGAFGTIRRNDLVVARIVMLATGGP